MSDSENEDDFGTRRRQAIFGDDGDTEDVEDETEDTEDDETEETKEARVYTKEELEKEKQDLLGRKVYTEDSIEDFISALQDGVEYNEAVDTYLKLMPDESDSGERDLLSEEYPLMAKELAEREHPSKEEYPSMKDLQKEKTTVSPENWKPIDDYPSMEEEFGKE